MRLFRETRILLSTQIGRLIFGPSCRKTGGKLAEIGRGLGGREINSYYDLMAARMYALFRGREWRKFSGYS